MMREHFSWKTILIVTLAVALLSSFAVIAEEKVLVPIVNQEMTHDEIRAAMQAEGEIVIANWTYGGLAAKYWVPGFKRYMNEKWDVDINVSWLGTQQPGVYMTHLYASNLANVPPPYDVMHLEIPLYKEAIRTDLAEEFLPSPIIPNYENIFGFFKQLAPSGLIFQALDTGGLLVNTTKTDFVKDYTDLADPRLKGHVLLPTLGEVHMSNFLINLALAMGKDYKSLDDIREVIQYAANEIEPNVLKHTVSEADMIELMEREVAWVLAWWFYLGNVEYMKGYPITWMPQPQGNSFAPGVAWIPKGSQHPLLAQAFMDYLLSPEKTMVKYWPEVRETPGDFMMLHQAMFDPSLFDELPEWLKPDYDKFMPWPLEKIEDIAFIPDWDYVSEITPEWTAIYREELRKAGY